MQIWAEQCSRKLCCSAFCIVEIRQFSNIQAYDRMKKRETMKIWLQRGVPG